MNNITIVPEKREEVLMPDAERKMLRQLYLIRNYSGYEEPVRQYITHFLDSLSIPYINYNGNILGFNHPGNPLFSAHMDMVNTDAWKLQKNVSTLEKGYVFTVDSKTCIRLYRDADKKNQTSLGADDKNGIWVILQLLAKGYNINFAFCHSEEIGGAGSSQVVADKELAQFIEQCAFGIIIDRRNAGDIIGYGNNYCLGLDDRLEAFSNELEFGYKKAHGSISDADRFSQLIECVNISCGYYEAHTSREYTNLNELWKCLQFCEAIIRKFNYISVSAARMQEFKKCSSPYISSKFYDKYSHYISEKSTDNKTYNITGGTDNYFEKKKETTTTQVEDTTDITASVSTGRRGRKSNFEKKLEELATDALPELIEGRPVISYTDNVLLVPLQLASEADSCGMTPSDIVNYWTCPDCGDTLILTQLTIDEMYLDGYNYVTPSTKIYGVCMGCYVIIDITDDIQRWL